MPARRVGGGEGTPAGHQGLTAAPSEGHTDHPGRRQRLRTNAGRDGGHLPAHRPTARRRSPGDRPAAGRRGPHRRRVRWRAAGPCGRSGRRPWSSARGENVLAYAKRLAARNIFRYCRRRSSPSTRWDGTLLRAWETTINPAGTLHLRGDVALARARDPARLARLGAMPARKVLVLGNHDFGPTGTPTETGSDETSMTQVVPEERTLLVTHVPLWRVPAGRVKVHGHVHNHERLRAGTLSTPTSSRQATARCPLEAVRGNWPPAGSRSHDAGSSGCRARGRLPRRSSPAVTGGRAWRSDCAGRRPASTCSTSRPAAYPARLG